MLRTNVDALLELLKEKKELSVAEAAKRLKISERTVENIAKYLEEEGILSISYKFMAPHLIAKDIGKITNMGKPRIEIKALHSIGGRPAPTAPTGLSLTKNADTQTSALKQINGLIESIKRDVRKKKIRIAAAKYNYMREIYNKRLNEQNKKKLYDEVTDLYADLKKEVEDASKGA